MPVWIKFWTAWGIAGAIWLGAFVVAEGWALKRVGYGDTLTETVVYLRETNPFLYWFILDVCLLAAVTLAWVIWHFKFWTR